MQFVFKQGSRYKNPKVMLRIVQNFNRLADCRPGLIKNYTLNLSFTSK
jgi:hypothetical protein